MAFRPALSCAITHAAQDNGCGSRRRLLLFKRRPQKPIQRKLRYRISSAGGSLVSGYFRLLLFLTGYAFIIPDFSDLSIVFSDSPLFFENCGLITQAEASVFVISDATDQSCRRPIHFFMTSSTAGYTAFRADCHPYRSFHFLHKHSKEATTP